MKSIPIVDLFAGPGGLGEGFSSLSDTASGQVFDIIVSVEKHSVAHQTLELRSFFRKFPYGDAPDEYYSYLRKEISREDLFEAFPEEAAAAKDEAWCATLGSGDELNHRLDERIKSLTCGYGDRWVLVGGPPCQAYSTAGRARRKNIDSYSAEDDERNFLYKEYLRILAEHHPAVFVMENVKGMLSAKVNGSSMFKKILEDLACPSGRTYLGTEEVDCLGVEYDIYSLVVPAFNTAENNTVSNAMDYIIEAEKYGIPQTRHRVVLLGVKKDFFKGSPKNLEETEPVCARHVIDGLPTLRSGLSREKDSGERWRSIVVGAFDEDWLNIDLGTKKDKEIQETIVSALAELEAQDFSRGAEFMEGNITVNDDLAWWYLDDRLGGACNHISKAHMNSDLHRYLYAACFAELYKKSPKILEFPPSLLPNHKNVKSGHFNDRFKVQLSDQPATTITSHISKDGHYYIHYDPVQCRSLTVREAARLQTFPDNYFFEGNRTQQYVQVGNAVPPLLARKIAVIVRDIFQETESM